MIKMARRNGMGTGTGKGYKNILGNDRTIHSQSARGIKQPQKVNVMNLRPKNDIRLNLLRFESPSIFKEILSDNKISSIPKKIEGDKFLWENDNVTIVTKFNPLVRGYAGETRVFGNKFYVDRVFFSIDKLATDFDK